MNDGYIQSKQRELKEKLDNDENREKILANKISAMERQIEQYQTVLDDIKKQSNNKKELFAEMKTYVEDINKSDKKQIQKQLDNFKKCLIDIDNGVDTNLKKAEKHITVSVKDMYVRINVIEKIRSALHQLMFSKGLLTDNESNYLNETSFWLLQQAEKGKEVKFTDIMYDKKISYVKQFDRRVSKMSKKEKQKYDFNNLDDK